LFFQVNLVVTRTCRLFWS